jgi:hypothetical protein
MSNLLSISFTYLVWHKKVPSFDLKTKEELQFTHHRHLKPLGHDPTKLFTKLIISRTKDNIININLTNKDILIP